MSWAQAKLRDVATIERDGIASDAIIAGTNYLGLEHIESGGKILGAATVDAGDLASTKFRFTKHHVLYGKLRPYLAKIATPDFDGICSTDIVPIMPGPKLDRSFLTHFLRQPAMIEFANSRTTGANLPRLSPKALADFEIPLPPLAEQKRIAAILDQADDLRRKRQRAIDRLNQLGQAIFHEMFGGGAIPCFPLGKIADLKRGPFGGALKKETFVPSGYKIYEQGNAIRRDFSVGKYFIDASKFREMRAFSVEANDIIVSCSGTLGRTYRIPEDAPAGIINQALLRIRVNEKFVGARYLEAFFSSPRMQAFLGGFARGTGLQNFPPMAEVRDIQVPIPSQEAQAEFLEKLDSVEELELSFSSASRDVECLFSSLQHRAFRGEL